jgi:hypothetical protein
MTRACIFRQAWRRTVFVSTSQHYPSSRGDLSTWELSDPWPTDNVASQDSAGYSGDAGRKQFVIATARERLLARGASSCCEPAADWL